MHCRVNEASNLIGWNRPTVTNS